MNTKLTYEQKLKLSIRLYYSARELKIAAMKTLDPMLSEEKIKEIVKNIFSNART